MHYTSKEVYEYISEQNNDPIVEWKTCAVSGSQFAIFQSDLDFLEKVSPVFGGKKYLIPLPTLCPEERQRRRMMFRNECHLYKRKCDASGETIISMYSPEKPYVVYGQAIRWGDSWDGRDYGFDFDFSKSFAEQYDKLMKTTPKAALSNDDMSENSNYVNQTTHQKNCYMTFDADDDENVLYSKSIKFSESCVDCSYTYYSQGCYESVNCTKCFACFFSTECEESSHLFACSRCTNCRNCFGCVNLSNKEYCISNKQYTKEEYLTLIDEKKERFLQQPYRSLAEFDKRTQQFPQRANYSINDEGSFGNNLARTHNCRHCFNIGTGKDLAYCSYVNDSQSCYDFNVWGIGCSYLYECITVGENTSHSAFNIECRTDSSNIYYCHYCSSCRDCFGCVSLKNQQYCIFNKQYTKEEYEKLVPQIIHHMTKEGSWGEFFQPSLSPYGYNESIALEEFPLSREESISKGYQRQENSYHPQIPANVQCLSGETIPSDITQVSDDILKTIFICEISSLPFRIVQQELAFYRKNKLPLPRHHYSIRHQRRLQRRAERQLHLRSCDKTNETVLSVYPVQTDFPVYSQESYRQEVYG